MNLIFDILLDLVLWLWPWSSRHEDRSVVGESDMDRQVRVYKTWALAILLALAVAAAVVWYVLTRES